MSVVVVDASLPSKLATFTAPVRLYLPDGRELGVFTPAGPPSKPDLTPPISEEGIAARFADKNAKTYTTAEVLAYLKQL